MSGADIVYYLPESEDAGADEDMYKNNELCHFHHGVDGAEYDLVQRDRNVVKERFAHRLCTLIIWVIILHPLCTRAIILLINIASDSIACDSQCYETP